LVWKLEAPTGRVMSHAFHHRVYVREHPKACWVHSGHAGGDVAAGVEVGSNVSRVMHFHHRVRVREHPKACWAVLGGVAAMLAVVSLLVWKLEFPGHGGLTSSPRSACTYSGEFWLFCWKRQRGRDAFQCYLEP
jgi:hypothetical protein